MCNCIEEFERKIVEDQPFKGKVVKSAMIDKMLQYNKGVITAKPRIQMLLEIQGRLKELAYSVAYAFCPFCGVKLDSEIERKQI